MFLPHLRWTAACHRASANQDIGTAPPSLHNICLKIAAGQTFSIFEKAAEAMA